LQELFKQHCPRIFRLIKVEEELRKEQVEMHKLLKAKQDLIDIQKKRIEHLTNRTNNANQNLLSNSTKSIGNNTNVVKNSNNNNNSIFQQLTNSIVAESSQSKDAWVPSGVLHVDKLSPQIAASPSSSSSSMTQFCKYLAQNTLIQPAGLDDLQASYLQNQSKRKSSYHQNQLEDALSKSSPRILSPTPHDVNGAQVDGTPSSTSSSSSALSTSSSLNHLNHPNNQSTNTTSSNNNNNNNSSNVNGSSFNFFRTSEL